MILKKPYAFLIKNFKIIHIIIFLLALYVNNYYIKISSFFRNYSSNNFYDYNIAKDYLPIFSFIAIILLISFISIMLYLMNKKKKPIKLYIFSIIYYVILLISMLFIYNVINTLYEATLTQKLSRFYRDIFFILNLPHYYFLVMYLIRGIGFDIKKFNFSKDLQELEINAEDNEEFEFVLGTEGYLVKRKIHRLYREIIYYYKENKFLINIVLGSILSIVLITVFINTSINLHKYHVGSSLSADKFTYKLNNAYVTSYDYKNKLINNQNKYLILDMTITNKNKNILKPEEMYIVYGNNQESIYKTSLANSFSDLGTVYIGDLIPNQATNLLFIYELPNNAKISNLKLMVYKGYEYKNGVRNNLYREYKFSASNLDKDLKTTNLNIGDTFTLGKTLYGNTNLKITNMEIKNKYEYTYQKCSNENNCETLTDIILPDNRNQNELLIVDYEINIDENSLLARSTNNKDQNIINKFSKINYTINKNDKTTTIYGKTYSNLKNKIFFDIPNNVSSKADKKNFIIKTRENEYSFSIN